MSTDLLLVNYCGINELEYELDSINAELLTSLAHSPKTRQVKMALQETGKIQ